MKRHKSEYKKLFKHKIRNKRITVMLVPNFSTKIRRLSIPYPVFGLIAILILVPFLYIAIITNYYKSQVTDLGMLIDSHENLIVDSSYQIDGIIDEKQKLEERLNISESLVSRYETDLQEISLQLDSFENKLTQLNEKITGVEKTRQSVLDVIGQLQEMNIPFSFDETVLTHNTTNPMGGTYTDDTSIMLNEMDVILENYLLDFQELESFTNELYRYFRARPIGMPVREDAVITSNYGRRPDPFAEDPATARTVNHTGIDFSATMGENIYATADGVVSFAGWHQFGHGNLVSIEHDFGYSTHYAHNSRLLVKEGDEVVRGQVIALAGTTGVSTGVHCHYEVWLDGVRRNPSQYLEFKP